MAAAAAATVGARCGLINFQKDSEMAHAGPNSVAVGKKVGDRQGTDLLMNNKNSRMSAAGKGVATAVEKRKSFGDKGGEAVVYERMDEWMKESVAEIVKNLREAPLLVHVYDGGETTTLRTEKGVEEGSWVEAIEKWKRREMPMPEGVIFVEQLEDEEEEKEEVERKEDQVTRAWGIVVQGRGGECGPVCYLLKTSRGGGGSSGLGLCCTHFCLMRVKSFRESAMSQLKNCWLN